jgi:hypothetical protein
VDFGILLLILFILAPLLEKLLKAGRPKEPPVEQGPGQQLPQQRQRALPGDQGAPADDEAAAGVLPDDLWEILTGERRPSAAAAAAARRVASGASGRAASGGASRRAAAAAGSRPGACRPTRP